MLPCVLRETIIMFGIVAKAHKQQHNMNKQTDIKRYVSQSGCLNQLIELNVILSYSPGSQSLDLIICLNVEEQHGSSRGLYLNIHTSAFLQIRHFVKLMFPRFESTPQNHSFHHPERLPSDLNKQMVTQLVDFLDTSEKRMGDTSSSMWRVMVDTVNCRSADIGTDWYSVV